MPKWDWFDDYMVMKILEAEENEEKSTRELFDESEEDLDSDAEECTERLEALQKELSDLQDELITVEVDEPDDMLSDSYTRWEARRDLLEEQIAEVESDISDLEI